MIEYKCSKCGEVYNSSIDYQKLFCLKCNTEILHPRLQKAQNELDKMHDFINKQISGAK